MKLTESKLRTIIQEELQRLTEMGPENLQGADIMGMHTQDYLEALANEIQKETGRDAIPVPTGRTAGMGVTADVAEDDIIIFEGKTQNVYISVENSKSGIGGSLRTPEGTILRSFGAAPSGGNTPEGIAYRIVGALRDVGET